jgi:hypothetical protein
MFGDRLLRSRALEKLVTAKIVELYSRDSSALTKGPYSKEVTWNSTVSEHDMEWMVDGRAHRKASSCVEAVCKDRTSIPRDRSVPITAVYLWKITA